MKVNKIPRGVAFGARAGRNDCIIRQCGRDLLGPCDTEHTTPAVQFHSCVYLISLHYIWFDCRITTWQVLTWSFLLLFYWMVYHLSCKPAVMMWGSWQCVLWMPSKGHVFLEKRFSLFPGRGPNKDLNGWRRRPPFLGLSAIATPFSRIFSHSSHLF